MYCENVTGLNPYFVFSLLAVIAAPVLLTIWPLNQWVFPTMAI